MASTYTLTRVGVPGRAGNEKTVTFDIAVSSYDGTNGVDLTLAELQMGRLIDLAVEANTNAYVAIWDGSLTAPKIRIYGQSPTTTTTGVLALSEIANAVNAGTFRINVRGR